MKKAILVFLMVLVPLVPSIAMAQETGIGAVLGAVAGGLAGSQLCGGKGGKFACGAAGVAAGSLIGREIEQKIRAPKDPITHSCRSGFRPIEVVTTVVADNRACLLNEQFEGSFAGWPCSATRPRHALSMENKPLCLDPSTIVEADTIREQRGYAVKNQQNWWPCALGTGQVWEKQTDGTLTPDCRAGYAQIPQPGQGFGGGVMNADYARGYYRGAERQERKIRRATEQAGYNAAIGGGQQRRGGLFGTASRVSF